MRYELSDYEWTRSNRYCRTSRGGVPRVNDCRVLNGIFSAVPGALDGIAAAINVAGGYVLVSPRPG
jgi:hypothetical protein